VSGGALYRLSVSTPEGSAFDGDVASAVVPGVHGLYGVFPGHAPMIGSVAPGILEVRAAQGRQWFVVGGGFAEVGRGRMDVLVDAAVAVPGPAEAEDRLDLYLRDAALPPTANPPSPAR
jgi:F-type H+-transporting ATPase subunit epsilon